MNNEILLLERIFNKYSTYMGKKWVSQTSMQTGDRRVGYLPYAYACMTEIEYHSLALATLQQHKASLLHPPTCC